MGAFQRSIIAGGSWFLRIRLFWCPLDHVSRSTINRFFPSENPLEHVATLDREWRPWDHDDFPSPLRFVFIMRFPLKSTFRFASETNLHGTALIAVPRVTGPKIAAYRSAQGLLFKQAPSRIGPSKRDQMIHSGRTAHPCGSPEPTTGRV